MLFAKLDQKSECHAFLKAIFATSLAQLSGSAYSAENQLPTIVQAPLAQLSWYQQFL